MYIFFLCRSVSTDGNASKAKFLQAARLVVAFRDKPKAKNVVSKDGEVSAPSIAFAIRSQPMTINVSAKTAASVAPRAAPTHQQLLQQRLASQDGGDDVDPTSGRRIEKDCVMSVMTDSFDDSPGASVQSSPVQSAAVLGSDQAPLELGGAPVRMIGNTGSARSSKNVGSSGRKMMETDTAAPAGAATTGKRGAPAKEKEKEKERNKGTGFTGSRKHVNAIAFQPPSDLVVPGRNNKASKFISKLKERIGKDKAQLVEQIVEDDDEASVVSSYFDHNAAPIFVEREKKPEKHVLVSKRFDKAEVKEYQRRHDPTDGEGDFETDSDDDDGSDYDSDREWGGGAGAAARSSRGAGAGIDASRSTKAAAGEDGEEYGEIVLGPDGEPMIGPDGEVVRTRSRSRKHKKERTLYNAMGEEIIHVVQPDGEVLSVKVPAGKVRKLKALFDLDKFVESVSVEEKHAMEVLDQVTINKIIAAMNVRNRRWIPFCSVSVAVGTLLFFKLNPCLSAFFCVFLYSFAASVSCGKERTYHQQEEPGIF